MTAIGSKGLALMGVAAASTPIAGPSNLSGAGFQNAFCESDPAFGHAPNILLAGGDDCGIQISFDGGQNFKPCNLGKSSQTWYFKLGSLAFDDYSGLNGSPNCVMAYVTNDDGTNIPSPSEGSGGNRGLHSALFYGVLNVQQQSVRWYGPIAVDNNSVPSADQCPLYFARIDASPHPRQSGDLMISDPNQPIFYIGNEDGIQYARLLSGTWKNATIGNGNMECKTLLYHSTTGYSGSVGNSCDNEVSSLAYSAAESSSGTTVFYATVMAAITTPANKGLTRVVVTTKTATNLTVASTKIAAGTFNGLFPRRVKVVTESAVAMIYVASNSTYLSGGTPHFHKVTPGGTVTALDTALTYPGAWNANAFDVMDMGDGTTRIVMATNPSGGSQAKVIWALNYSRSGQPTWLTWNSDVTYWTDKLGGGGIRWWLTSGSEDAQASYPPTFSSGSSFGASVVRIGRSGSDGLGVTWYIAGRSGCYRRIIGQYSDMFHPIVQGSSASVCNDFRFDRSTSPIVAGAEADVDWRNTIYSLGPRVGNPVIRRFNQPGNENKSVVFYKGILYSCSVVGQVTQVSAAHVYTSTPAANTTEMGFAAVVGSNILSAIAVGSDSSSNVIVLAFCNASSAKGGMYRKQASGTPVLIGTGSDGGISAAAGTQPGFSRHRIWWDPNGTQVWFYHPGGGLFRSQDAGLTWVNIFPITGTGSRYQADVIEDPSPTNAGDVYFTIGGDIWHVANANETGGRLNAAGTRTAGSLMTATDVTPTNLAGAHPSSDNKPAVSLGPLTMSVSQNAGGSSSLIVNDQGDDGVTRDCSLFISYNQGATWQDIACYNWKAHAALAYTLDCDQGATFVAACDGCGMCVQIEGTG